MRCYQFDRASGMISKFETRPCFRLHKHSQVRQVAGRNPAHVRRVAVSPRSQGGWIHDHRFRSVGTIAEQWVMDPVRVLARLLATGRYFQGQIQRSGIAFD